MNSTIRDKTEGLRLEAWLAVKESPFFAQFKALDDAVKAMGGSSLLASTQKVVLAASTVMTTPPRAFANTTPKRVSQGDAAEAVLRELNESALATDLIALLPEKGATVGGDRPLPNFTSTLSRDDRFHSFRRNGQYYWGLTEWGAPLGNEPEPVNFDELLGSDSLSYSSQGGGDGHGPATTLAR